MRAPLISLSLTPYSGTQRSSAMVIIPLVCFPTISLRSCPSSPGQLVEMHDAALHDEPDALQQGNVPERVAGHRDQVRILTLRDAADPFFPPEDLGVKAGGRDDRGHRRFAQRHP